MKTLGQAGSGMPRVKPGDFGKLMQLLGPIQVDEPTKTYLSELVAIEASIGDRDIAVAERERLVTEREAAALDAEETARADLAELAALKAAHDAGIRNERATLDAERRRLDEQAKELDAEQADLNRREAALRQAFDAYQGAIT